MVIEPLVWLPITWGATLTRLTGLTLFTTIGLFIDSGKYLSGIHVVILGVVQPTYAGHHGEAITVVHYQLAVDHVVTRSVTGLRAYRGQVLPRGEVFIHLVVRLVQNKEP